MIVKIKHLNFFLILLLLMSGCQERPKSDLVPTDSSHTNFRKLSTDAMIDQTSSNQAKETLQGNKHLTKIHAVNTDEQLLITFEIQHFKRFQLEKIRKDVEQQMKRQFPQLEVYVSTDEKIISELADFEEKLIQTDHSKVEIQKKITELIDLSQEET